MPAKAMDNPGTILVVDDSADDVTLLRLAMKQAGFNNPLEAVTDADQAVQYLKGEGRYADRKRHPLPALVLLDLKLPNRSGIEVLAWLRQQPGIQDLPVIVLSNSYYDTDIRKAYHAGANSFIVKPLGLDEMAEKIKAMGVFWLRSCELPPPPPPPSES